MEIETRKLRDIIPDVKQPKKRTFGKAKYPIVGLAVGASVTIKIESPQDERRLRKSADNWNRRNEGFINAHKKLDKITFTRWR